MNDKINKLIIGNTYTNTDICDAFKCSLMKGMAKSNTTNTLVLIANHTKNLYNDKWIENILYYTGEGQEGDQSLDGQNKTLYESGKNGIKVYLFEVFNKKEYIYQGEVYLAANPYKDRQMDKNNNERNVWIFPIKKIDNNGQVPLEIVVENEEKKEKIARKLTDVQLNANVKKAKPTPGKRTVTLTYIERDSHISEKTKRRANGICDLCKKEAPFKKRDNQAYLETHHVITLAEDGPDQIYNTVALCPNCHRRMHILKDSKDINLLSETIYNYLLSEEEKDFLQEFEKLFNKNQ